MLYALSCKLDAVTFSVGLYAVQYASSPLVPTTAFRRVPRCALQSMIIVPAQQLDRAAWNAPGTRRPRFSESSRFLLPAASAAAARLKMIILIARADGAMIKLLGWLNCDTRLVPETGFDDSTLRLRSQRFLCLHLQLCVCFDETSHFDRSVLRLLVVPRAPSVGGARFCCVFCCVFCAHFRHPHGRCGLQRSCWTGDAAQLLGAAGLKGFGPGSLPFSRCE
jgi:hypothetical protein